MRKIQNCIRSVTWHLAQVSIIISVTVKAAGIVAVCKWMAEGKAKPEHHGSKEKDEPFARPIQLFWEEKYEKHSC